MAESVNDKIHDALIPHDVALRRIDGDCRRRAEKRLDRLGRDLKALIIRIDPFGASRKDARERRVAKLEDESKALTREAYADINAQNRADLRRIARIESEAQVAAIGENLP